MKLTIPTFFLALSLLLLMGTSCQKTKMEVDFCGTTDYREIPWLNTWIENAEKQMHPAAMQVILFRWNGEDVFLLEDCMDCADAMSHVHDCEGTLLCTFGGIAGQNTCPAFQDEAVQQAIIWNR